MEAHSGSLSWLSICLHDTITKCHAGTSHSGVSSPWLLYWSKNYTLVQNFTMVSCKRKMTTSFSVKSVCWWTGMGSSCIMFVILNCTCVLSTWSVPSNNWDIWNDPSSCKCNAKSHSHPSLKLVPVWVFPCKHPLSKDFTDCFCDLCILLLCVKFVQGLNKASV